MTHFLTTALLKAPSGVGVFSKKRATNFTDSHKLNYFEFLFSLFRGDAEGRGVFS
jgi:hypothetical protein